MEETEGYRDEAFGQRRKLGKPGGAATRAVVYHKKPSGFIFGYTIFSTHTQSHSHLTSSTWVSALIGASAGAIVGGLHRAHLLHAA
jgi:hypothetical protein